VPTIEPSVIDAGTIELGQSVTGELDYGERDAWILILDEAAIINIAMVPIDYSGFDTYLYLNDARDNQIGANDDSLGSTNSTLLGRDLSPGAYTILAASFSDSGIGPYTLAVTESEFIEFGGTIEDTLPEDGTPFIRAFQVDEPASATFTASLVNSDLTMAVRDLNIAVVDHYGADLGVSINTLDVPLYEAGTYTVAVSSFANPGESFTLEIESGPPIEDGGGTI
jgi:hypothetical protein